MGPWWLGNNVVDRLAKGTAEANLPPPLSTVTRWTGSWPADVAF